MCIPAIVYPRQPSTPLWRRYLNDVRRGCTSQDADSEPKEETTSNELAFIWSRRYHCRTCHQIRSVNPCRVFRHTDSPMQITIEPMNIPARLPSLSVIGPATQGLVTPPIVSGSHFSVRCINLYEVPLRTHGEHNACCRAHDPGVESCLIVRHLRRKESMSFVTLHRRQYGYTRC